MLKRKKEIIAKVMATTMLASTLTSTFTTNVSAAEPQTKATVSETTIAGDDRYKTAVEISKNYSSTSKHAVIVNGQKGIVDALTATPYASLKKAPILMTQSTKLNADTKKELTRRGVKTVDIVGGVNSVSDAVKAEIEAMGIKVNRIAGDSKYDTALEVAKKIDAISDVSKIAVANGEVLADAVSVAAPAAQNKMPIILAHPTKGLDAEVKKYIDGEGISTSYVIGGTSSVSTATQNSLPGTKKRLEGTDRQGTNASVIKEFYTSSSYDNMYVAKSGQVNKADEIADALAVGVLAASKQDPVMLVGKNLGSTQKTLLESKDLEKITKVGGNIPTASIDAIKNTQSSTKTVTTVAELKTALANAKDGDIINFNPSTTVSEAVSLSTTKNVTVNLNGTHSGAVSVDMANGTLNINGNVSNKVSVNAVKAINVKSGVTVKHLEIKSGAKNSNISNNGTVTTFDVLATGVKITGSGKITTLNPQGDTDYSGFKGEIANLDTSKPVSQVIAQNAKELVIRFSKQIDKSSIIEIDGTLKDGKIALTSTSSINIDGYKASLDESRMALTITAPKGVIFDGSYRIDINEIYSNGTKLDNYSTTFKAEDKVAPTVTGVVYNQDNDEFEITLSEPVDSLNGLVLRVNNKPITLDNVVEPTKKLVFSRNGNDVAINSNATIYMAGIKDAANNVMTPYNGSVNVTNSTLALNSVSQYSDNEIKVVFSKKLSQQSQSDILSKKGMEVYKMNNSVQGDNINISDIRLDPSDDTNKTYILTIDNVLKNENKDSQYVSVKVAKYKRNSNDTEFVVYNDVVGNKISESTNYLTLNKDKVHPTVTNVEISSDKTSIEVTMSEAVTLNESPASKVRLRMDGANLSNVQVAPKANTNNILVITTTDVAANESGKLKAGTYQVRLENGLAKDLNENDSKEYNSSNLVITKESLPALNISKIQKGDGENIFEVISPATQRFTLDSLSYSNFKIDGKVIPSDSDVYFKGTGHGTIIVKLPSVDSVNFTGSAVFEATGLKLESGRLLNDKTETVQLTDNTAPTLMSAKVSISNKNDNKVQIKLTFDENIAGISESDVSAIKDELVIKRGYGDSAKEYNWGLSSNPSDTTPDAATYSVNGKELTITITKGDNSNLLEIFAATWSSEIHISTKELEADATSNIKDANGVSARVNKKVSTNSVSEEIK